MRNFKLQAKIRRVVASRSLPSTFGEIYGRIPQAESRELKEELAAMVDRGSLVAVEYQDGVVRYSTAARWGGPKS